MAKCDLNGRCPICLDHVISMTEERSVNYDCDRMHITEHRKPEVFYCAEPWSHIDKMGNPLVNIMVEWTHWDFKYKDAPSRLVGKHPDPFRWHFPLNTEEPEQSCSSSHRSLHIWMSSVVIDSSKVAEHVLSSWTVYSGTQSMKKTRFCLYTSRNKNHNFDRVSSLNLNVKSIMIYIRKSKWKTMSIILYRFSYCRKDIICNITHNRRLLA